MRAIIVVCLIALPSIAHSQQSPAVPVAVQFVAPQKVCGPYNCAIKPQVVETGGGSGTVVAENGTHLAVLTNAHVVAPSKQNPSAYVDVHVMIAGQWIRGTVVASDDDADLAVISVPYTGRHAVAAVSGGDQIEEPVTVRTFVRGQEYREDSTRLVPRIRTSSGTEQMTGRVFTQTRYQQGESGGGIYNSRGELVAVVEANDNTRPLGIGIDLGVIRTFIGVHLGLRPARRYVAVPQQPQQMPQQPQWQPVPERYVRPPSQYTAPAQVAQDAPKPQRTDPTTRKPSIVSKVAGAAIRAVPATVSAVAAGEGWFGVLSAGLGSTLGIGLAGATGGAGIAIPIAMWLLRRRLNKSAHKETPSSGVTNSVATAPAPVTQIAPAVPVTIENPPIRDVIREQTFVSVTDDIYQQAIEFAFRTFAQKYPNELGTVEFLRSVMSQYLSSKGRSNNIQGV